MRYEIWFKLADEGKEEAADFQKQECKEAIENAIEDFNKAGGQARNQKNIYKKIIEKNIIKIYFESKDVLEKPTKSFRYFSKYLIDNSDAFKSLKLGNRLFKGVYIREISNSQTEEDRLNITDEQMLQTLIHWCMSHEIQSAENKKKRQAAIEKIKSVIEECIKMS